MNPIRCEEKNCGLLWGMGSQNLISMCWCAGLHREVWLPKCAWKSFTYIWVMVWNSLTGEKSDSWLSMHQYDLSSHELTEDKWWTDVCDVLCSVVWISFVTFNLTLHRISSALTIPLLIRHWGIMGMKIWGKKLLIGGFAFCVCDQRLQGWWSSGNALRTKCSGSCFLPRSSWWCTVEDVSVLQHLPASLLANF